MFVCLSLEAMKMSNEKMYKGFVEWEIEKAIFLQSVALKIKMNLSEIYVGVNQNSGNVWLYSEYHSFCLYMPVTCELSFDHVWVSGTADDEEVEKKLSEFDKDQTLLSIENWVNNGCQEAVA